VPRDLPPEIDPAHVAVIDGSTFAISEPNGDIRPGTVQGLFHRDTRWLDRFELLVQGRPAHALTWGQVEFTSAGFFLAAPELEGLPEGSLSLRRERRVDVAGLHEDLWVTSHVDREVRVEVRVCFGTDFADLFEVKDQNRTVRARRIRREADRDGTGLSLSYRRDGFAARTIVAFTQRATLEGGEARFDVVLAPRGEWQTCVKIATGDPAPDLPAHEFDATGPTEPKTWRAHARAIKGVPRLECAEDLLEHVYGRSVLDLRALRLGLEVGGERHTLPAAGLPWFMTIFGRDSLITAYQSLLVGSRLAEGALRALARMQGQQVDDFTEEEPGRIMHELRFGELTATREVPFGPYFGTADATGLWLILLSEHRRWTGDDTLARELRPNAMLALEWLDRFGDRDGDGFVEYLRRSPDGLENQGWKDSWDGVRFSDGELARQPLALCEVQGYTFDAKRRAAELAREVWGEPDLADRLEAEANELAMQFDRAFWVEARDGHYAIALDADKRQVDAVTSNMGHLLWSGIVPEHRARRLADRLMREDLFSGWGVRTTSTLDRGYSPLAYHNGTVWPHDNSLISAGLGRYGFRTQANTVAMSMLEAAAFSDYRLSEVFAGYERSQTGFPVRYPTASSPQAWATAAPFLWLRVMLGLHPEGDALACDPHLPTELGLLRLTGVRARGRSFDVEAEGNEGSVTESSR
jgi:glycogen debranching enzyme